MATVNTELIARVVRQTQLMAKLDHEIKTYNDNSKGVNELTQRVIVSDTNLFVINLISLNYKGLSHESI